LVGLQFAFINSIGLFIVTFSLTKKEINTPNQLNSHSKIFYTAESQWTVFKSGARTIGDWVLCPVQMV